MLSSTLSGAYKEKVVRWGGGVARLKGGGEYEENVDFFWLSPWQKSTMGEEGGGAKNRAPTALYAYGPYYNGCCLVNAKYLVADCKMHLFNGTI